ncbi:MAG: hypothetical protein R3247_18055, partial [Rhodothermales bacterium]|nr:hypothetical protein [Rhodothermales bacterium]
MPPLRALNGLDYAVVVLYLLAVAAVGLSVARFNRRSTDYFKGGGHIPWGLSAVSLFVSGFSAFMFVGAAGFAYRNGSAALVLFSLAAPAYGLGYLVYGRLWRRTRIETPMQFLARRFSPSTTYFYTLLAVVPNVLILGILVYTLCIFVASALGFGAGTVAVGPFALSGFQLTLVATGLVMIAYTLLGGLWAVMVTDALQFVILLVVSLLVLPVALAFLGDGSLGAGAGRLVREAPPGYFSFTIADQPPAFWLAYFVNIVLGYNVNWHVAQRYYSVPDERGTRRMAAWCAGLSLALPLLWVLPVMAARVLFPDLDARWPGLAEPSEAAVVTLALATLPHGLLGVMTAALFAATMSSVDTTLNWLAAVLTKDVAVPVGRRLRGRAPSERAQLLTGRLCVAALGAVALAVALSMERYGGAFDVYLRVNSLYSAPMFIPVLLGLVYTRTPWWSGMASFGAGVVAVVAASLAANAAQGLPVAALDAVFLPVEVEVLGVAMGRYELNTFAGVLASGLCFFGSALANRRGGAFAERIAALERDLRTPAYATAAARDVRGARAYRIAGALALGLAALLAGVAVAVPEG